MFPALRRRFSRFKAYRVVRAIYWRLPQIVQETELGDSEVTSLLPEGLPRGTVLLSHIRGDFLNNPDQPIPNTHTNFWVALDMAKTFLELGYRVDVISFGNHDFLPKTGYDVIIDTRYNLQRLAPLLGRDCLKILHIDTAHMLFQNAAEANRLLDLQGRRGVTLLPVRYERPNLAIEHADCATICANDFTIGTYRYAGKPIYQIPIPAARLCPWPDGKDFSAARRHFLWFASHGMVHKGLDLVLEAFAGMPEYRLTICGPVEREPDFVKAYRKELFETPNIHLRGWIDIDSREFLDLADRSIAHVFTSASEGGAACVIETMHTGLIPIVNYESSVDVHDFGVLLKGVSVEEIRDGVRMIAEMPASMLEERARRAWGHARAQHTREHFSRVYRQTIREILREHGRPC